MENLARWSIRCILLDVMGDLTRILERAQRGDSNAANELIPLVYDELRRLAAAKLSREAPGQTLQPTALVHEAWLRLGADDQPAWENRGHFFGAAAEAMRRILVDAARKRTASKRGAGAEHTALDGLEIALPERNDDELLQVNEALDKLALIFPKRAELVKLRYFVGLTFEEASAALGIAVPTAKEWWAHARAWLAVEIGQAGKN
jgi:RNA polymerase sigma factor (TIGR02999 family)